MIDMVKSSIQKFYSKIELEWQKISFFTKSHRIVHFDHKTHLRFNQTYSMMNSACSNPFAFIYNAYEMQYISVVTIQLPFIIDLRMISSFLFKIWFFSLFLFFVWPCFFPPTGQFLHNKYTYTSNHPFNSTSLQSTTTVNIHLHQNHQLTIHRGLTAML